MGSCQTLLIINVKPKNAGNCVQCDATIRRVKKAGLVEGADFKVREMTASAIEQYRAMNMIQAPVCESDELGVMWSGFRLDQIANHVKSLELAKTA